MKPLSLAFFPIVRLQFDTDLAGDLISRAKDNLISQGFELISPTEPVTDLAQVREILQTLPLDAADLLLVFQGTFADSSMVVEMAEAARMPVFLWAVPEPWTGERLRLNSLCGINLAGHALHLRGLQVEYAFADPDDKEAMAAIKNLALASRIKQRLKSSLFAVAGDPPSGLDTCRLDETRLRECLGLEIERIDLDDLFERALDVEPKEAAQVRKQLNRLLPNLEELEQPALDGTLRIYCVLKEIAAELGLNGLAVRCWPEFFTELGCAACGALSLLSDGFGLDAPLPCGCEADINGTVTQWILQSLAGEPAFGTDIVGVETDSDRIALWHCGMAPLSMANPSLPIRGGIHSNRKLPLVMDFTLRPGRVTLARLSQATGELRLVIGTGEMLDVPRPFFGTSGTLRLDYPTRKFLDTWMREGLEHHVSMVYGDHLERLQVFARLMGLPVLNLEEQKE